MSFGWTRAAAAITAAAALASSVAGPRPAEATVAIGKAAQAAGYSAQDCAYCHTFDLAHMLDKARRVGVVSVNCATCHPVRLPKSGAALFNDRGQWLLSEKKSRNAASVDAAWLHGYVAPSPSPSPAHTRKH